ncbi:MAG: carbohydrate ABC transporter permease [Clostridiales bacterium]|nr:carbohydrate ABC transporter permease [Clostridiales bacterium]
MLNRESLAVKVIRVFLSAAFCLFALVPIYSALIVALTPYSNMLEAQLFPHYFELSNFVSAFDLIGDNILNSFIYATSATLLTTAISVPAAYAIARYRFKFRRAVLFSLLLTQMMAGIVILPTLYKTFNALGMLDSPLSLILVYSAVNLALVVTIHHGYFASLPREIDEAAEIDGCNYLQTLWRIIFPISGPGIAVGAIFVFINSYNEFVIPLFLLSSAKQYPLTLTVYSLVTDTTIRWHIMAAASLIGIIPPVAIFTFFQKYIIKGVTSGAVKG